MKKLRTYEEYSQVLAAFKENRARCATNKLMTRNEVTALIDAEKLYYDEIDGVFWIFEKESDHYIGSFFVPKDTYIRIHKLDMDVLIDLTGNQNRYNERWEQELIAAGCEKGDKRLEYVCQFKGDMIDTVKQQCSTRRARMEQQGLYYRKATRADYPELKVLWKLRFGEYMRILPVLTDTDWDEIEEHGRCDVICEPNGKIIASYLYTARNKVAYGFIATALYQGKGHGGAIFHRGVRSAYEEGNSRFIGWIRKDNINSIMMTRHVLSLTGKYYYQFVCRAKKRN